ncbi:MAG: PHP domain-containing protein [Oscillospiraceae bacterium]|nr:PHP domain-containing protein [Oscillospiraceae bacterium]
MILSYDFHLHSCLSPCGDDDAYPTIMAGMAKAAGADASALTDHNASRNCRAFLAACEAYELIGLTGMEMTTSEEVHVLCLLPSLEAAAELEKYVRERQMDIRNKPDIFGWQFVTDENDVVISEEKRLLITAASISVSATPDLLASLGGIAIPAHIDRSSFSLLSNLGAFDRDMGFPTVELSTAADPKALVKAYPALSGVPFIVDSDAHRPGDIPDITHTLESDGTKPEDIIRALREGSGLERL